MHVFHFSPVLPVQITGDWIDICNIVIASSVLCRNFSHRDFPPGRAYTKPFAGNVLSHNFGKNIRVLRRLIVRTYVAVLLALRSFGYT